MTHDDGRKTGPDSASPGDTVTYTLRIENPGPHRACGVLLEDLIPAGVTSPVVPPGCTLGEGVILCPVGDLPAGDEIDLVFTLRVEQGAIGDRLPIGVTAPSQRAPLPFQMPPA